VKPSRRLGACVTLAALSALFTLSLLEIVFRVRATLVNRGALQSVLEPAARPAPGSRVKLGQIIRPARARRVYELIPDLDVVFLNAELHTSAQGFRGPALAPEKRSGEVRVLGLGDSVMFGWGVDYVDSYLARLDRRLARERPERLWGVLNTAVPGYNTVMEVETLKEKGLSYSPDLVLLNVVGNDLGLPNFVLQPPDFFSVRHSFLLDFVRGRLGYQTEEGFPRLQPVPAEQRRWWTGGDLDRVPPALRDLAGLPAFRRAMAELADLGRRVGFRIVVLAHPEAPEFARQAAAEHGFLLVETKPALEAYAAAHALTDTGGPPLTLTAADPHPSVVGHQIIAEVLHDRLSETGILDELARRPSSLNAGPGRGQTPAQPPRALTGTN
jgi:lysophospholipase L1-like esterase